MKNKIYLEIYDSEGGDEAKLLVHEMCKIYIKSATHLGFDVELLDSKSGYISLCL